MGEFVNNGQCYIHSSYSYNYNLISGAVNVRKSMGSETLKGSGA